MSYEELGLALPNALVPEIASMLVGMGISFKVEKDEKVAGLWHIYRKVSE